jgi:hypothetical protein
MLSVMVSFGAEVVDELAGGATGAAIVAGGPLAGAKIEIIRRKAQTFTVGEMANDR